MHRWSFVPASAHLEVKARGSHPSIPLRFHVDISDEPPVDVNQAVDDALVAAITALPHCAHVKAGGTAWKGKQIEPDDE